MTYFSKLVSIRCYIMRLSVGSCSDIEVVIASSHSRVALPFLRVVNQPRVSALFIIVATIFAKSHSLVSRCFSGVLEFVEHEVIVDRSAGGVY